jgi:hypothetical protein
MTRFRPYLIGALLAVAALCPTVARAQTTLNSTTTSASVDNKQQVIPLTAVTNISASSRNLDGDLIVIDREFMQVNAVDTSAKTVTVRRGYGSQARAHASGAFVWSGPKQRFSYEVPAGNCTSSGEQYLPRVIMPGANSILGGDVYDCINSTWTRLRQDGFPESSGLVDTTSTASGTVQSTEYTLNSVTLNATDWGAARGVRCIAIGTSAANANAKNLKFYFGATAVTTLTGTTDSGKDYLGEIVVLRSGASTQLGYGSVTSDVGAPDAFAVTTALAESESAAIVIAFKSANTAAAAASATGKGMYCNWLP